MKSTNGLFLVIALVGFSQAALGAWTIEQLKTAQEVSLETFRQAQGETAYANIFSFSIEKNTQETAGKAKIVYREAGVKKEVSFFCHEHDGSIDCH